ncbi:MAG: DUF3093 domain-containing protein [Cryobacterium sp.]|nr:DUF3093 domain-containing protein [Cryobacterium sp.]
MTHFREKVHAAPWVYISTALVIPASLIVFLPINPWVGIGAAIVLYGLIVLALVVAAPTIEVTETEFVAGRARIERVHLENPLAFRGQEATLERGQRLDARAWLVIRGWVDPVVRVTIADPDDSTPYWLVSTRRPDDLVAALAKDQKHA